MSERSREALPDFQEGSGGPREVREGSGGPFRGLGGFVSPSQRSGMGREALLEVW